MRARDKRPSRTAALTPSAGTAWVATSRLTETSRAIACRLSALTPPRTTMTTAHVRKILLANFIYRGSWPSAVARPLRADIDVAGVRLANQQAQQRGGRHERGARQE